MNNPTITVLGAGYVGLTSAVLFARANFKVYLIEPNQERLRTIRSGKSFFYEAGVNSLLKNALDDGRLIPTDSYEESVPQSDVIFSCVGTPDNPDGSSNLSYVFDAAQTTLKHAKDQTVYVQKSTVPVGTGRRIMDIFDHSGKSLSYISNPEFLREGTAIVDTLFFDRVVVGGDDIDALNIVTNIYKILESSRDAIANEAEVSPVEKYGEYFQTDLNSAELIKVTSNAFLAMKISFANSIAKLADRAGANIKTVMQAVGSDERIGKSFLSAGRGYGGGCFPKDVSGLLASAESLNVDLEIIRAVQSVNSSMPGYIISKITSTYGSLSGVKIAVLGLAFKAGTSDTRRSPGLEIASRLHSAGGRVYAYDPQANHEAAKELHEDITICNSLEDALKDAKIIVIATDWPEFTNNIDLLTTDTVELFVDAVNGFNPIDIKHRNIDYIGVGQS